MKIAKIFEQCVTDYIAYLFEKDVLDPKLLTVFIGEDEHDMPITEILFLQN